MNSLRRLLLGVITLAWAATLPAQIVFQEDFTPGVLLDPLTGYGFTIEDLSGDGLGGSSTHGEATWFVAEDGDIGPGIPFWAGNGAVLLWDGDEANDDWAITPGIALTAGQTYNLSFDLHMEGFSGFNVSMEVRIGNAATSAAQLAGTQLADYPNVALQTTSEFIPFTVPSTGTYYISFHDYSAADANYVMFGNVVVEQAASFASNLTPAATTSTARRGFEAKFPYTLSNTGSGADTFTIAVTGGSWTTTLYEADGVTPLATNPVPLAGGGGAQSFVVGVAIPGATAAGVTQNFTVSATGANSNDSSTLDVTSTIYDEPFTNVANGDPVSDFGFTTFDFSGVSVDFPAFPTWFGVTAAFLPSTVDGMTVLYDSAAANDDWAITPGIYLEAGPTYELSFFRQASASFPASLRVQLGNAATVVAQNAGTTLFNNAAINNAQYESIPFTVGTTGTYYIGFHDTTPADQFYTFVGDIEVVELPSFGSDLTPDTLASSNGRRGQTNRYTFTVNNTGGTSDDFTLAVSGGTWTTSLFEADGTTPLVSNPVTVGAGSSFSFVVAVGVPTGATLGATENFTVGATGTGSGDSSTLDVTAAIYNEQFPGTVLDGPLSAFGFTVLDLGGTGLWRQTPIGTIGSNPIPGMRITYDSLAANNDWAITPGIHLESTASYNLTFERRASASFPATFTVYLGNDVTPVAQTGGQTLMTRTAVGGNATETTNFTVPVTGTYYLGFHDTTPADEFYTFIGDIEITELPPLGVDIVASNTNRTVQRSASTSYSFVATNSGSVTTDYNAAVSGNAWTTTLFESDGTTPLVTPFTLTSGGTKTIIATVQVPAGATVGGTDTFSITVEDTGAFVSDAAGNTTTAAEYNWGGPSGTYYWANHLAGATGATSYPPAAEWIDITGIGTNVTATLSNQDDGRTVPALAINHAFSYFGVAKTQVWAQANGFIAFTDPGTGTFFTPSSTMPNAATPNDIAAIYWRDLRFDGPGLAAGTSQLWYHSDANRTVISYINVARWMSSGTTIGDTISMQAVLTPNGRIRFNYQTAGASFLTNASASGTIGLENAAGSSGVLYRAAGAGGPYQSSPLTVAFGPDQNDLPVELSGISLE